MGFDIVTGILGVIFCITLALVLFLRRKYGWHDKVSFKEAELLYESHIS